MRPKVIVMNKLKYVTYRGLYCKLCSNIARKEIMEKGGWKYFGEYEIEVVMQFWNVLEKLSTLDRDARGCKGGCGPPNCEIRKCAQERNIITCAFCPDFPFELVEELDRKYPIVIKNLKKAKRDWN